jgi:hypothetical protein
MRRSIAPGTSARSIATRPNPACLQHEIERFERAIDRPLGRAARLSADPQHPVQIGAGRVHRRHVEPIERVHERHQLAALRGRGHRLQQQRGAARRAGAGQLRELAPRHTVPQTRIDSGDAGLRAGIGRLLHGWQRRGESPVELFLTECRFQNSQRRIRHMFASHQRANI